jgi:hypothetical protein
MRTKSMLAGKLPVISIGVGRQRSPSRHLRHLLLDFVQAIACRLAGSLG